MMTLLLLALGTHASATAARICPDCSVGLLSSEGGAIREIATAPSGQDIYLLEQLSTVTEPARYSIVRVSRYGADSEWLLLIHGWLEHLRVDESNLYFMHLSAGARQLVALSKDGGSLRPLVDAIESSVTSIEIDAAHVYWVSSNRIERVSKSGGDVDRVVTHTGSILDSVVLDESHLYYALYSNSERTYQILRRRKDTLVAEMLGVLPDVTSLSIDGPWLYVATRRQIYRIPKSGGHLDVIAQIQGVDSRYTYFDRVEARNGRLVARQNVAIMRGCVSDGIFEYGLDGTAHLLSQRGGDFILEDCGILHAPADCWLIPPRSPFILEQFCVETPLRRRTIRRP